jgi:bacteriorhodopsin
MSVLCITLEQTQNKKQFIYIAVSMITLRTSIAFQTLLLGLLLNLQQSFMELGLN